MRKIRFIYNPVSGQGLIKQNLDIIIEKFQRHGFQVIPHKLLGKSDTENAFDNIDFSDYFAVVGAGGDGTIHDIVNCMEKYNIKLPLGILPCGTSNDFANFLGLPKNINDCIDIITIKNNLENIDIGKINNSYFINVIAGGVLSSIAHKTQKKLKNSLGMFAYYFKALEEMPNIKPFDIQIISEKKIVNEKALMFLVLNTSVAGGFNLVPDAKINDGLFDVFLIKNCNIAEFGGLFLKLLRGEHIQDEKVVCFRASSLEILSTSKIETDIDGEKGIEIPLNIEMFHKHLQVFK